MEKAFRQLVFQLDIANNATGITSYLQFMKKKGFFLKMLFVIL